MDKKTYNGKIYSIRSHQTDLIYIGSTCQTRLSARFCKHLSDYRAYLKGKSHYVSSFEILQYSDAYLELVDEVEDKTKDELHKLEGEHIRNNKCVNKNLAGRTRKEYTKTNMYKISPYMKEYYEGNKDKILENKKQYYEDNRDKILERLAKKYTCECGIILTFGSKSRHSKKCEAIVKHVKQN